MGGSVMGGGVMGGGCDGEGVTAEHVISHLPIPCTTLLGFILSWSECSASRPSTHTCTNTAVPRMPSSIHTSQYLQQ